MVMSQGASHQSSAMEQQDPEQQQKRPARAYLTYWPYSLVTARMTGMMTKVTTVRRQEAANMKKSTMVACVTLLKPTFMFRHTWSETVVVSAASLQAHSCMLAKCSHMRCMYAGCPEAALRLF